MLERVAFFGGQAGICMNRYPIMSLADTRSAGNCAPIEIVVPACYLFNVATIILQFAIQQAAMCRWRGVICRIRRFAAL